MEFIKNLTEKNFARKLLVFSLIAIILFFIQDTINLILLTFVITFLIYSIQTFFYKHLSKYIRINSTILVIIIYSTIISSFIIMLYKYIPVIVADSKIVVNQVIKYINTPPKNDLEVYIHSFIKNTDIENYLTTSMNMIVKYLTDIGHWGFNILVSLVLSLFFFLEKNMLIKFVNKFKESKLNFLYEEIEYFGKKFLHSFGKVIQAQIMVAITNTIISSVTLILLGFPYILGLSIMILVLSMIPVAGTFISLIPLSLIAFSIGGISKVFYVLVMVAVIHAVENYFLNPKFMSSKTKIPVFLIFLILIISEKILGVWGLIVGIPIFMFILDLAGVNISEE